jgi:ATP-dependent DNA ligase
VPSPAKVTKRKREHVGPAQDVPTGAKRAPLPAFIDPSLALLAEKPPSGPQWVHEIKFDGYRIQARIEGDDIRLLTRKALDWTKRFPTIAAALRALASFCRERQNSVAESAFPGFSAASFACQWEARCLSFER